MGLIRMAISRGFTDAHFFAMKVKRRRPQARINHVKPCLREM